MKILQSVLMVCILMVNVACSAQDRKTSPTPPSHDIWDQLTKKHVRADGMVDYKGFIQDKDILERYLDLLSNNAPDPDTWSKEERLAYWINAYNAFTIKLIIDNYPVESIQDLHPTLKIPGVNTVWHKKFFKIGGVETSLDEIEHDILRKKFDEPRIHFAINCASFSCPPLRKEAYKAEKLNKQLDEMAHRFINDEKRNKITPDNPEVSKIFSWFTKDFTKHGSLRAYLNKYSDTKIKEGADIDYMDYDWRLNDIK
ncbi:MAG: DUF547 domain-containing protein [Fulvivirga sp.]|nr:DUF547 domain-containing protein [Fulvivirga sp.]